MYKENVLENYTNWIETALARKLKIRGPQDMPDNLTPPQILIYTRSLLEAEFKPRKFILTEIEGLLLEVFKHKVK